MISFGIWVSILAEITDVSSSMQSLSLVINIITSASHLRWKEVYLFCGWASTSAQLVWNETVWNGKLFPCGFPLFEAFILDRRSQILALRETTESLLINPLLIRNVSLLSHTKQTLISVVATLTLFWDSLMHSDRLVYYPPKLCSANTADLIPSRWIGSGAAGDQPQVLQVAGYFLMLFDLFLWGWDDNSFITCNDTQFGHSWSIWAISWSKPEYEVGLHVSINLI